MHRLLLALLFLLGLFPAAVWAAGDELGFMLDVRTYAGLLYYGYDTLPSDDGERFINMSGLLECRLSLWAGMINLRCETGATCLSNDRVPAYEAYDDGREDVPVLSTADLTYTNLSLHLGLNLPGGLILGPYLAWRSLEREIACQANYPYDDYVFHATDRYLGGGAELMWCFGGGSPAGLLINQGVFSASADGGIRYYSSLALTSQLPFLPVTENFTAGLEVSDFYGGGETYLVLTARVGVAF